MRERGDQPGGAFVLVPIKGFLGRHFLFLAAGFGFRLMILSRMSKSIWKSALIILSLISVSVSTNGINA